MDRKQTEGRDRDASDPAWKQIQKDTDTDETMKKSGMKKKVRKTF